MADLGWTSYISQVEEMHDAVGELVEALRDLVERCDGDAGVRADGSNIDTLRAHMILNRFLPEEA